MSAPNETLSDWIWDRLHDRDWTRADLARAIPIDPAQVTRWLKGKDRPSRESATRLSDIFGVHPSYVLALAGHEPAPSTEIDLSDPLVSFAAMNQDKLTDAQKRAMIAMATEFLKGQGYDVSGDEP